MSPLGFIQTRATSIDEQDFVSGITQSAAGILVPARMALDAVKGDQVPERPVCRLPVSKVVLVSV
jgi:hypothetical protein